MKRIKREVKTYEIDMKCDCGGYMRNTGKVLLSYPAMYEHKCDQCGKIENYRCTYPNLEYKYIEID